MMLACRASIVGPLLLHERTCRPRRSAGKKCGTNGPEQPQQGPSVRMMGITNPPLEKQEQDFSYFAPISSPPAYSGRPNLAEPRSEFLILQFEVRNPLTDWRQCLRKLAFCKPRSDMLRAIPVEGLDVKQEYPLNFASVARCGQSRSELGIVRDALHLGMCEDLEPAAIRVVHQEQRHAAVGVKIAHADILTIAPEILKAVCLPVQQAEKSGRSAAMLHVRPSVLRDGRHVKAIARLDECRLPGGEDTRPEFAPQARIVGFASIRGLRRLDAWRREDIEQ